MNNSQDILLEAGTNELEVVEFKIGQHSYAVNALKVRQFVINDTSKINPIPDSHESIIGSVLLQGQAISVVDLKKFLSVHDSFVNDQNVDQEDRQRSTAGERKVVIFCEFNNKITGYLADEVHKIQRITWEDIRPLGADVLASGEPKSIGVVVIDGRQITMLDFEKINADLFRNELVEINERLTNDNMKVDKKSGRDEVRVFYAEDSLVYLEALPKFLSSHGYSNIRVFDNGADVYEVINDIKDSGGEGIPDVIVTDIEMPRMDGLTLCKRVKELYPQTKVLVMSSLINEQMAQKCRSVNADAYIVKKDVAKLIEKLDQLVLG